jgi:hypothetical protein
MASWRWIAILGAGALALGGCGSGDDDDDGSGGAGSGGSGGTGGTGVGPMPCGALTSEEASRIAIDSLSSVLHGAVEATRFTEASVLIQKVLGQGPDAEEPFALADDANTAIDEMLENLRAEVLVDANVESATESSVTYHLTPEVNCPLDEEYYALDPDGATLEQEECGAELLARPVRYTVSRIDCDYGDAVSIVLEVGEERIVPGVLTASASMLKLRLDVAETVRAVQADDPSALFDADSSGTLAVTLTAGYGLATLSAALETDVVAGALESENPWRFSAEASPYAVELTANSESTRLAGGWRFGTVDATLPLESFAKVLGLEVYEEVPATDTVDVHVPRLSSGIDFDAFAERLVLFDVGLPTVSVRSGEERLFSFDLNEEAGWSLNGVLELSEDAEVVVKPSPGLTLDLGFALAPVQDRIVELPPYMLEDRVRLALEGEMPSATLFDDDDGGLRLKSRTEGPVLRVDEGDFVLSSEAVESESVSAGEDECLLFDPSLEGEHPILRGFVAGECP